MKNNQKHEEAVDVFDQIAPGWYGFRHRTIFRRELEELARRWQGGRLLNVGCAHGPDFIPFAAAFELYGVDFSGEMLRFALKYSDKFGFTTNLALADAAHLPFDDDMFDWVISVAVYHHIREKANRMEALRELRRVLKPGGEAFVTVWNRWQPRFWLRGRDVLMPWRTRGRTLNRYYHLFSYGELTRLARRAGFAVLRAYPEGSYHFPLKLFSRNICLLVKKEDQYRVS
ncbi:MAG: methyltransferase domain-containing protein [Chloroflexi bacterium]|nr:methyltransferase domain-containing protein [Chloroflexota bacterium]